ncbi:MAG: transporter, partial [Sedimenticolaceae bacterium]
MKIPIITALALAAVILLGITGFPSHLWAEGQSAEALAKAAQNPVANMISLPLQNNTNFGVGPGNDVQNVLNIQPVIPFKLGANWNLITRTIAPLIYQPELVPGAGSTFGLGDI